MLRICYGYAATRAVPSALRAFTPKPDLLGQTGLNGPHQPAAEGPQRRLGPPQGQALLRFMAARAAAQFTNRYGGNAPYALGLTPSHDIAISDCADMIHPSQRGSAPPLKGSALLCSPSAWTALYEHNSPARVGGLPATTNHLRRLRCSLSPISCILPLRGPLDGDHRTWFVVAYSPDAGRANASGR